MTIIFTSTDYLLSLPMIILAVFALGILLIDLMLPRSGNGSTPSSLSSACAFSAAAVLKMQYAHFRAGRPGVGS